MDFTYLYSTMYIQKRQKFLSLPYPFLCLGIPSFVLGFLESESRFFDKSEDFQLFDTTNTIFLLLSGSILYPQLTYFSFSENFTFYTAF